MFLQTEKICREDENKNRFYLRKFTNVITKQEFTTLHVALSDNSPVRYVGLVDHSVRTLHVQESDYKILHQKFNFSNLGLKNLCIHKYNGATITEYFYNIPTCTIFNIT